MPDSTETQLQPNEGIQIGENAVARIRHLIETEANPDLMLRIGISGGGCSGFQYTFGLDTELKDDDLTFEEGGIKVVVDETSLPFVNGATLDFKTDMMGAYFVMDNPNADSTCGCGSSFSV